MTLDTGDSAAETLRERLTDALAAHDKPAVVVAALEAVERGDLDVPTLYDRVLAPLMVDIGARWQLGTARVWEEHLAANAVRTIVDALYPTIRRLADAGPRTGRAVLLTCPPDEGHDLGLCMLADRFDLAGWKTYLLGADVPGPEIAAAAEDLGVELVVITSSTHFHRLRVRSLLDELRLRMPSVRVVVGGPAFAHGIEGFEDDEIMHPERYFGSAGAAAGG
jgi:methanogenic corrinoid protein MtbC1